MEGKKTFLIVLPEESHQRLKIACATAKQTLNGFILHAIEEAVKKILKK